MLEVLMYEGGSVNRSQMDIKRKTCDIRNWNKIFISRHILHQHWYICPIALPVRENSHSIEDFGLLSQPLPHLRFISETFGTEVVF
jgi:hypothetical protein